MLAKEVTPKVAMATASEDGAVLKKMQIHLSWPLLIIYYSHLLID
jgi:hypothetical protein